MSAPAADDSSWTALLEQLAECLQDGDYEDAVTACRDMYDTDDPQVLPMHVKRTVVEIHCKCELQLEHYDEVLALCKEQKEAFAEDEELLQTFLAYAHYRMHRYEQARREVAQSESGAHIEAQCRYRLHEPNASELYSSLLQQEDGNPEERLQTMVNAVAVELARATPYVETGGLPDGISVDEWKDDEQGHDLLYNMGSYQLITSQNSAAGLSLLEKAERTCASSLEQDGLDATEIASEVAPIRYHVKSWSRQWRGKTQEDDKIDSNVSALQAVQKVNRALANSSLNGLPPFDPTWTALQQRLYHYNRAILQLRQNQHSECLRTCQAFSSSSRTKDNKAGLPPYSNANDEAWWKAHVAVLQAHALQHPDKAVKLLQEERTHLQEVPASPAVDHALAHVLLHLANLEERLDSPTGMIEVLQELPASIQNRNAVVATLASLYQEVGNHKEATALLQAQEGAMVDFYMSQGDYEAAAKLCEESGGDKVRLVEALSYIDPERAQKVWEELDIGDEENDLAEELDGAQLEELELPRRSRKATSSVVFPKSNLTDDGKQKKKSHDAVLRRRAVKKDAYLNKLISEGKYNPGRPSHPDPERWIPKHERSYNRRRRQRHQNKGHQGGGSDRDAAKLDVAARKGEQADGGGARSTAHLGVAGGPKRGRRKR